MTDADTTPTFEEIASSGGHKDATMHVGGHDEPWPDIKVLAITHGNVSSAKRTCAFAGMARRR